VESGGARASAAGQARSRPRWAERGAVFGGEVQGGVQGGELGAVLDRWSRGRSRAEQATQARGVIDGVTLGTSKGGVMQSTGINGGPSSRCQWRELGMTGARCAVGREELTTSFIYFARLIATLRPYALFVASSKYTKTLTHI
jgi:hypothetical protein